VEVEWKVFLNKQADGGSTASIALRQIGRK